MTNGLRYPSEAGRMRKLHVTWAKAIARAAVCCLLWTAAVPADEPAAPHAKLNTLFARLTTEGHDFGGGIKLKLPEPTLPDGLDAAGQKAVLETIADRNRPLPDLVRDSVVAPFVLKLHREEIPPAAGVDPRIFRRVDLWFVAHGNFDGLTEDEQIGGLFDMKERERPDGLPTRAASLTAEELAARKLMPAAGDKNLRESWSHSQFVLLEDVLVSAVRHAMLSRSGGSLLLASAQDPRFDGDAEYPNRWQAIKPGTAGKAELGPPQAAAGGAFLFKITPLVEPAGASLVELHQVFEEPFAWYQGGPKLSSKLGVVIQDEVRRFRKKLAAPQ